MSKLIKKQKPPIHLIKASNLKQRVQGLIGHPELKPHQAFWITNCPSIHTFFMKFPLDVIFTDQVFTVTSVFENVRAGKILWGGLKSQNVFEMKAGQITAYQFNKGDQLYVES